MKAYNILAMKVITLLVLMGVLLMFVIGCISIQIVECDATPESCTTEAVSIDIATDIQPKELNNE